MRQAGAQVSGAGSKSDTVDKAKAEARQRAQAPEAMEEASQKGEADEAQRA